MSADIVKEWGKAFDLKALMEEEKKELSGMCMYGAMVVRLSRVWPMLIVVLIRLISSLNYIYSFSY